MHKLSLRRWVVGSLCTLTLLGCSNAAPSAAPPAPLEAAPKIMLASPTPAALAAQAGAYATSVDSRGVPTLLVANGEALHPTGNATEAARFHLSRFFAAQGVDATALATAETIATRDLGTGGHLVHLRQRLEGVELYGADVKVLLRQDNELVAISGSLRRPTVARTGFRLGSREALAAALSEEFGVLIPASAISALPGRHGAWEQLTLEAQSTFSLTEPAHLKQVYFPQGNELVAAYLVEFSTPDTYRVIVAASDGRVLERASLTAADSYNYRVFADPTDKHPADGPSVDYTPHPTGVPNGFRPPYATASLVAMESFNVAPAGAVDPWLPAGSTETVGNNVDAYGDPQLPDGYSNGDLRAVATALRTFDYTYDLNAAPINGTAINPTQLMAGVTNAFYVTNWLHDYWYNAGFDEVAGNAQFDNYQRGGLGGDRLRIEAQDRALNTPDAGTAGAPQRNNANMNTPSDGFSPRMQIYLWNGYSLRELRTSASATALTTGNAVFGPQNFDLTAPLALADDGVGATSDGCQALINNVAGKVVIVDRGTCTFKTKTLNAQNAGAVGVVLANNAAGAPPNAGDDATIVTPITIGTLTISQADGTALKTALTAGTVNVDAFRKVTAPEADAALDNTTIAHEYGHYWHHRLQDCTSNAQCRGMSEGWGDFVALHFMLRDGDNLDGTFADSTYASMGSSIDGAYFGIRRYPYSSDLTKNPLTFRFVADQGATFPPAIPRNPTVATLSEVHNAGEIWASTLFDAYIALQRARGTETFAVVRDRFARDMTTALQLAPRDSTYTEMRDAILAAISARSATDRDLVANAFARRGFGTCAVSPARYATEGAVTGVVETFSLAPSLSLGAITLDDQVNSCDRDGLLDAEETGKLTLSITNTGAVAAAGTTLTVANSNDAGVQFPNGTVVAVPTIAPFATVPVTVDVRLDSSLTQATTVTLDLTVELDGGCVTQQTQQLIARLNTDEAPASSANDDVESETPRWTLSGQESSNVWAREVNGAPNHVWHGTDLGAVSDTSLESPDLQVAATGNFVVTFRHKYKFEFGPPPDAWDGAVIEVTEDNGVTWRDVTTYGLTPGYGGNLTNPVNPLGITRPVFRDQNAAYPAMETVTLDFGTQLAGKTVRLRFRIGTDAAAGEFGWQLDDFTFTGLTNTPFGAVVADRSICQRAPVANAGADQTVARKATVQLDASGSTDANNDPLTFTWSQTAGPSVTLITTAGAHTGFVAPAPAMDTVLTFSVVVSDGTTTATDTVDITVTGNGTPVANAGADQNANRRATVVLDASGSMDPNNDPLTFAWTQTAGPTVTLISTTGARTSFVAPAVAAETVLTFSVTVSDGTGMATDTVDVTVAANGAPVANAGAALTIPSGSLGVLDGSGSTDPDGDALTGSWVQVNGTSVSLADASRLVTTFTAPTVTADEVLTFDLTTSDGTAMSTARVAITVLAAPAPQGGGAGGGGGATGGGAGGGGGTNRAPTANAGMDVRASSGEAVFLKGSGSTDPDGDVLTFSWAQTSGTPAITLVDEHSSVTGFKAPVVEAEQELVFELTVTDDGGLSSTDTVKVILQPAAKASGCSCSTGGEPMALILALGAMLRRRRR